VRLMQEGGARMVKLESGTSQLEIVEFLTSHDIAVCAHLGLKPQSVHKTGGFRVQGREAGLFIRWNGCFDHECGSEGKGCINRVPSANIAAELTPPHSGTL